MALELPKPPPPCPSRKQLEDFVLGRLTESEIESLSDHAAKCARCGAIVEDLDTQADDLLQCFRHCGSHYQPERMELDHLMSNAMLIPGEYQARMGRRRFILGGAVTVAAGAIVLGGGWGRRAWARSSLTRKLIHLAQPSLMAAAKREIPSLPEKGRTEILAWFHGKCLNAAGVFVDEICSTRFIDRIRGLETAQEQHELLQQEFFGRVMTPEEATAKVRTICEELGKPLDHNWSECRKDIATRWNVHLYDVGGPLPLDDFNIRVDALIRAQLQTALDQCRIAYSAPTLLETIGALGNSAMQVLPLFCFGPNGAKLAVPLFIVQALSHAWDYFLGLFHDPRDDLRTAVSQRVATLGLRVGDEFAAALRESIGQLHSWRASALDACAREEAERRIRLF